MECLKAEHVSLLFARKNPPASAGHCREIHGSMSTAVVCPFLNSVGHTIRET